MCSSSLSLFQFQTVNSQRTVENIGIGNIEFSLLMKSIETPQKIAAIQFHSISFHSILFFVKLIFFFFFCWVVYFCSFRHSLKNSLELSSSFHWVPVSFPNFELVSVVFLSSLCILFCANRNVSALLCGQCF